MSRSDKSRRPRHHSGHSIMKRTYNRTMRRLTAISLREDTEPPNKLPGFKAVGFCCGNHSSDWRY